MKDQFSDDWITKGWSRVSGKWLELGGIPGITVGGVEIPPELSIHDVADKLNALEASAYMFQMAQAWTEPDGVEVKGNQVGGATTEQAQAERESIAAVNAAAVRRGERWRAGSKVPLNAYEGDRPVCQCHSEEDARRIVAAMNRSDMEALQSGNVKAAALDKFADVVMARNEEIETIRQLRAELDKTKVALKDAIDILAHVIPAAAPKSKILTRLRTALL